MRIEEAKATADIFNYKKENTSAHEAQLNWTFSRIKETADKGGYFWQIARHSIDESVIDALNKNYGYVISKRYENHYVVSWNF